MKKVIKFGGTSLADASQIKKVESIVNGGDYNVVVVSAPGKRNSSDTKITDILIQFSKTKSDEFINEFIMRVEQIETELSISNKASDYIKQNYKDWKSEDEIVCKGEYVSALMFSELTGRNFVDPADCIIIEDNALDVDDKTYENIAKLIKPDEKYVMPGFYGRDKKGNIKTFTRGGSDTTGSVVARAIMADLYENFTDVSGVYNANPKVIPEAKPIANLTYKALRSMAKNGTEVFCLSAIKPVENIIPIQIKNTNRPSDKGTRIVSEVEESEMNMPVALTQKDNVVYVVYNNGDVKEFENSDIKKIFSEYFC